MIILVPLFSVLVTFIYILHVRVTALEKHLEER